jgi:hypothetical protein
MKNRTAGLLFLLVCVVLAILLLTKVIKIFLSGIVFAIALVVIGLLSRGVRKEREPFIIHRNKSGRK